MSFFPTYDELCESIINDCYSYLDANSSLETKKSIKSLLEIKNNYSNLAQKSYVVFCSIAQIETNEKDFPSIYNLAKEYFTKIDLLLSEGKLNQKSYLTEPDYCLAYISLCGYKFIFTKAQVEDLISFKYENYHNYTTFLKKYEMAEVIKDYYETNIKPILSRQKEINDDLILNWVKILGEKNSFWKSLQYMSLIINEDSFKKNDLENNSSSTNATTYQDLSLLNHEEDNQNQNGENSMPDISNEKLLEKILALENQIKILNELNEENQKKFKLLEENQAILFHQMALMKTPRDIAKNIIYFYMLVLIKN